MASTLSDEQSTACSFIGVANNGRDVTFITKTGRGYTYTLDDNVSAITLDEFQQILTDSVGKYWSKVKAFGGIYNEKNFGEVKELVSNWGITADFWGSDLIELTSPITWKFNTDSVFNF